MLSLFQRKRPPVAGAPPPAPATVLPKGLMRPESAASLLATPRRQKLLEHIWQRTSLSRRQFATLYRAPWNATPSWSRPSRPPRRITMPIRAACSTTASKSSPTA
jgi:hypothetical protein